MERQEERVMERQRREGDGEREAGTESGGKEILGDRVEEENNRVKEEVECPRVPD